MTGLDQKFMKMAIEEAKKGRDAGGIPIGSVLVLDNEHVLGHGHNQRVQKASPILHAEMDCIENAGRLTAAEYQRCTIYSTLSPCDMCSGAILLFGIPRVVIGEHKTFCGPENYSKSRGVEIIVLNDEECEVMMTEFIQTNEALWNEDIGM